ncbi:hyaluronan and proteoglycan link protein 2-like [Branchiostoma floridae x Branchiostoma japonicum]
MPLITRLVDRVSTLEEQLTQERAIWAVLEGRVNATAEQGDLAARLKTDVCSTTPKLGRIFQAQSPAGRYKYDLDEARHACAEQGASLASYHHLYEAWQDGLEYCACGWLSDGTARYPMQTARTGCGSRIGIITCSHTSSNAWCFRQLNIFYRPPAGERCAPCNQVLGVGTDEGLKSELDRMKIVVKQLSRKIADWLKDRVSSLEEQLAQERTIRTELEGRVDRLSAHVQNTTVQDELIGVNETDLCSTTPKLGRLFHVQSPAGHYTYDLDEARHACAEQGASLASYHHLYEAWQDGLERCACGWLSDGTARYPMQEDRLVLF